MANQAGNNPKDVNPQLRESILRYQNSQTDMDYQLVFQMLFQGEYLVATDYVGYASQSGIVESSEQEVSIKTINGSVGEAMMAFTDTTSLIAHSGEEARYLTVDTLTLLGWAMGEGLAGLVINPVTSPFFIERVQVEQVIQRDARPRSFSPSKTLIDEIGNEELDKCIEQYNLQFEQLGTQLPDNFLELLWRSTLLLPMEHSSGNSYVTTLKTSDGLSSFPVFSSLEASRALGSLDVVGFKFEDVLALAVQYPCQSFVINPGAQPLEIAMQKIKHLYELVRQTGQVPQFLEN